MFVLCNVRSRLFRMKQSGTKRVTACAGRIRKYGAYFCAPTQATTDICRGVHYRQPALKRVSEVLNEVDGNRANKHRLMDYDNHPDTTLADNRNLLRTAQTRLEKRLR